MPHGPAAAVRPTLAALPGSLVEPRYRHGDHHVASLRDGVGPEEREDQGVICNGKPLLRHQLYLALLFRLVSQEQGAEEGVDPLAWHGIDPKALGELERGHVPLDLWSVTKVMSSSCSQFSPVKE